MASANYDVIQVNSSPFNVTNDHHKKPLVVFVVNLASGTVNLPSSTGFVNATLLFKKRNAGGGTITIQPAGTDNR